MDTSTVLRRADLDLIPALGHVALNKTAPHVLYTGGPYDSHLLLPLSSHT
jgi:hypothetical protein